VAFESALVTAEAAGLPLWRLRALHELGTIDLLDHAGVERLSEARRAAEQMGALSTVAILDLQLAAAFTCRWELDTCDAHARAWGELARFCAAPAALADGWGDPLRWLAEAEAGFDRRDLPRLAERCRELLKESQPNPWVAAGITAREADVLRLVADGLANKQIAARLQLSPRTVEKHVESLLRKTGARSRTVLVAAASQAAARGSQRAFPPSATT
jgi:DNA-binding CsgD family transcriptional regulator